ncbi:hypothetical protein BDZ89DRAFT_273056 [Hymenopellis radicata]|nr:hypothetical protein BDZ89DRAFT_273056 [Hymenopellis radicata]
MFPCLQVHPASSDPPRHHLSSVARHIHGWSWQAFPVGMGTGAVYITLSGIHNHPSWLTTVETVFYSLSIVIFAFNVLMLSLQVTFYPSRTWRLINHPVEGAFIPLMVLCLATIIIGTINYAHSSPQLSYILFWVYVALSLAVCFPMLMIWFGRPHDLTHFTPAYAFLIFPMMLVGVISFNVLSVLDPSDGKSMGILLFGYFFQGLGFFMTFFYICIYVMKIIQTGIYDGHEANSAFIVCGPPGFTALALIHLGQESKNILAYHPDLGLDGSIWYSANVLAALMLYGLAVYFFVFDVLPYTNKLDKQRQGLHDILGYWALTFPNVGWISATRGLGDAFDFHALYTIHLVMTIIVCVIWGVLAVLTALALWRGKILKSSPEDVLKDTRTRFKAERDVEKAQRVSSLNVHQQSRAPSSSPEGVLKDTRSRIKAERDVENAAAASLKVPQQCRAPSPPVVQSFYSPNLWWRVLISWMPSRFVERGSEEL